MLLKLSGLVLFFYFTAIYNLSAQSCGFGCLGLSGVYGGYSIEKYKLDGLNKTLNEQLTALGNNENVFKFEEMRGLRVGANIFRAKFSNFFLTAKGFYQFLKSSQEAKEQSVSGESIMKSDLSLNHWGFGIDIGFPIFSFLNLKLFDGGVNLYTSELMNTFSDNIGTQEKDYNYSSMTMGYYAGSGLIIELIKNYVSLEGTAYYQVISINNLVDNSGNKLPSDESGLKFVDKGGLSATVQLNIGISF